FEAFAARRDIAWLSQHLERMPSLPALAALSRLADVTPAMRRSIHRSDQRRPWVERLRVGPVEAYSFWERCCGERFRYDYLLGAEATPRERDCLTSKLTKVVRYQGKPRFAAKITGPGRIAYLSSIFPDARFINVIRDGRAVVQSLMRVPFWQRRDRMHTPAWRNGLTSEDYEDWREKGGSPVALAAVQWRRVTQSTRDEGARHAPDRYAEVHYERFVEDPAAVLDAIAGFCGLPPDPEAEGFLITRFQLQDMNFQWRDRLSATDVAALHAILGDHLESFGYEVDPPRLRPDVPLIDQPCAADAGDAPSQVAGAPPQS